MAIALGSYPLVEVIFRPGAVDDWAWGHQSDSRYPIDNYAGLRDIPKWKSFLSTPPCRLVTLNLKSGGPEKLLTTLFVYVTLCLQI